MPNPVVVGPGSSAIEYGLDPGAFAGLIGALIALAAGGYPMFERRDLRR